MHGIIFHMDLQSVPLSFGINDCTKLVPEGRECEHSPAPPVGLCSAVIWATSSHHREFLPLAAVGSALSIGKGHLPPPTLSQGPAPPPDQRCHPHHPATLGAVREVRTQMFLLIPASHLALSVLAPSETCHWAKTHTLSFIFNSELFLAAKVV